MTVASRYRKRYQALWRKHNTLPAPCYFCSRPVLTLGGRDGCIHHKNGDETDDRVENLAIAHWSCHHAHHLPQRVAAATAANTGSKHPISAETRAKISATKKGKPLSEAAHAAALAHHTGSKHTAEHKAKIGDALRGRKRGKYNLKPMETCPVCGREFRFLRRHRNQVGH